MTTAVPSKVIAQELLKNAFADNDFAPLGCRLPFLGGAENRPQSLPHNDFLARLDGHGNQFYVTRLFAFFRVGITLANRRHQTRVIRPEHLNDWITSPQILYAVGQAITPCLLVPGNLQSWIAVSIGRNVDIGFRAGHRLY